MSNATNMDNGAMDDSSAIDKSLAALFFFTWVWHWSGFNRYTEAVLTATLKRL